MRVRCPDRLIAAYRVLLLTLFATLAAPVLAQGRAAGLPDFTDLYEKQGPAVVSVDVTQTIRRSQRMPDISEDDPFYEFFKRFGPIPRRSPDREFEAQSTGSGFIVSPVTKLRPVGPLCWSDLDLLCASVNFWDHQLVNGCS